MNQTVSTTPSSDEFKWLTAPPYETKLIHKFRLRLDIHESGYPAWFEAIVRLDPISAQHGIEKYSIVAQVGLDGDTASYLCQLTIPPSTSRHVKTAKIGLNDLIAEGIQAAAWKFSPFAEFLRQRVSEPALARANCFRT